MRAYRGLSDVEIRRVDERKQRGREEDDHDMADGRVTPADLQRANSMFTGFDMSRARLRIVPPRKPR
ncbi:hypothetical protein [Azospirillum argentinense]|nr:hypothetical protein [Azospirillum argentinense]